MCAACDLGRPTVIAGQATMLVAPPGGGVIVLHSSTGLSTAKMRRVLSPSKFPVADPEDGSAGNVVLSRC